MIYFDNNSTTPVNSVVFDAMLPYFKEHFGNASSSTHAFGWHAKAAIDLARNQVSELLNVEANEIIFNSGSTEGINTVLKGVAKLYQTKGKHFITCKTEHSAVLDTFAFLEKEGFEVSYLDVDREGLIDIDELKSTIKQETIAVCIMLANNETGVVQDIAKMAEIAHEYKALMICDTTQAFGKMTVDIQELGIDVAFLSAHKIYGPKGVGAMYVRRKQPRVSFDPLLIGGGQENGRRAGTYNTTGIVGIGMAAELIRKNNWDNTIHLSNLRNALEHQVLDIEDLRINGNTKSRIYNTSNLFIPKYNSKDLIQKLGNYAFSLGSACNSANATPSHVLTAMQFDDKEAQQCIRISFGVQNTMQEVNDFVRDLKKLYS